MKFTPTTRSTNPFDLFDEVFSAPLFRGNQTMRTDIREVDGKYVFEMDLPGYAKEDIQISLYNGNLTIRASHNVTNEEKDASGTIIRQERYSGACERSFYVGDAIKETDIKAMFKDGILKLEVPTEKQKEIEEKRFINID